MTNPIPQPHADDVKLAEAIFRIQALWILSPGEVYNMAVCIASITTPLRLSNEALTKMLDEATKDSNDFANKLVVVQDENEALRERVKELESALHRINDTICIHHNDAERATLKGDCRICQNNKLTAASEVMEKCERAFRFDIRSDGHSKGCSYDRNGNNPDSDFCSCFWHGKEALSAIKEWKGK